MRPEEGQGSVRRYEVGAPETRLGSCRSPTRRGLTCRKWEWKKVRNDFPGKEVLPQKYIEWLVIGLRKR